MNTTNFIKHIGAVALAASSLAAHAGVVIGAPAGVSVTLGTWAYGAGNSVQATGYSGVAGAFIGSLSGAGAFDVSPFVTYCIELEEHFSFGTVPMAGYSLVDGERYFRERRGNVGAADHIGRLLTFAADQPMRVDSAAESTSMQLAIWNLVYENDDSMAIAGEFGDSSAYGAAADALLAGAATVATSRFDIYALTRTGSQDFLLAVERPAFGEVPEPTSLALVAVALGGIGVSGKRRKSG